MTPRACICRLLAAGLAVVFVPSAAAIDSVSFEAGGGGNTQMTRIGLQSQWHKQWLQSDGTHLGGYWDLTFSRWRKASTAGATGADQNLTDAGITPVLRLQSDSRKGFYAEAGVGVHLLSSNFYNNEGQRFSTRFQFGDHFGLGYVTQSGVDLSLKIQHFSNGGIKQPNPGVLFGIFKLGYAF